MDIKKRVSNLEKLVDSMIKSMNNQKFYTDTDISGLRKGVFDVTPYTETKTEYIGDTEIVFDVWTEGNLSVYVKDSEGNYPDFTVKRMSDRITVAFEPLENVTTITISIN
jgi:hypothetical protein